MALVPNVLVVNANTPVKTVGLKKKPLSLARPGRLELKKTVEQGQIRQSFSHGRSKAVTVEVRRKRTYAPDAEGGMTQVKGRPGGMPAAEDGLPDTRGMCAPSLARGWGDL